MLMEAGEIATPARTCDEHRKQKEEAR